MVWQSVGSIGYISNESRAGGGALGGEGVAYRMPLQLQYRIQLDQVSPIRSAFLSVSVQ